MVIERRRQRDAPKRVLRCAARAARPHSGISNRHHALLRQHHITNAASGDGNHQRGISVGAGMYRVAAGGVARHCGNLAWRAAQRLRVREQRGAID